MYNILLFVFLLLIILSIIKGKFWSRYKSKESITGTDFSLLSRDETDSLRGIAIIMVFLAHVAQNTVDLNVIGGGLTQRIAATMGGLGVSLFFMMSGYGNYYSIGKCCDYKDYIKWLIKRVLKIVLSFILCLALISIVIFIFHDKNATWIYLIKRLITLKVPYQSTWYLKVQILLYFFLAGVCLIGKRFGKLSKYTGILVAIITFIYAFIGFMNGIDYKWWKTSMCFSAGVVLAQYRSSIEEKIKKHVGVVFIAAVSLAGICWIYIIFINANRLVPQMVSYIGFCVAVAIIVSILQLNQGVLKRIGSISLELYLVHIGIMYTVFASQLNQEIQILVFTITTMLAAVIAKLLCGKVLKLISDLTLVK